MRIAVSNSFLSILLLCLSWAGASAQTNAAARFDSAVVETGQAFTLHLIVPGRTGQPQGVDWSAWQPTFPDSNRLAQTGWQFNAGNAIWTNDVTLITFDSARLELPPLPILLKGGDRAQTNATTLNVIPTPSPNDPVDMADIKDIQREPARWTDYLLWILIGAGVVLLVLGIFWWRAGRKKRGAISRMLALSPDQLAIRKLEALAQKQLWQKGQVKDYYDELSFILREYLEKAFQAPALESTTREIARYLIGADWPQGLVETLRELLQQADLAKFAKTAPPQEFHEQAMAMARKFVEGSRAVLVRMQSAGEEVEQPA